MDIYLKEQKKYLRQHKLFLDQIENLGFEPSFLNLNNFS